MIRSSSSIRNVEAVQENALNNRYQMWFSFLSNFYERCSEFLMWEKIRAYVDLAIGWSFCLFGDELKDMKDIEELQSTNSTLRTPDHESSI